MQYGKKTSGKCYGAENNGFNCGQQMVNCLGTWLLHD